MRQSVYAMTRALYLHDHITSINRQVDALDPSNIVTREKQNSFRYFVRISHPAKRMLLVDSGLCIWIVLQVLRHRRAQEARAYGVAVDTVRGVVECDLLGQLRDGAFTGCVGGWFR